MFTLLVSNSFEITMLPFDFKLIFCYPFENFTQFFCSFGSERDPLWMAKRAIRWTHFFSSNCMWSKVQFCSVLLGWVNASNWWIVLNLNGLIWIWRKFDVKNRREVMYSWSSLSEKESNLELIYPFSNSSPITCTYFASSSMEILQLFAKLYLYFINLWVMTLSERSHHKRAISYYCNTIYNVEPVCSTLPLAVNSFKSPAARTK